ncbi:hypothetical protein [Fructobacillus parabroussonetiae]|uniref:hypothetical protein n=1 Tax=Fructobacillus parabroussonetiae TaxID=2713174 RepID=UPI001BD59B22|nr:hypothetical protein [Fructobacillus parabroussonetiae]MCK8617025.1 hypothetical protein [Fructobacillus parabroussonetiae]
MVSNQEINDLVKLIQPLFKKERNTIYEVHLVYQLFSDQLNIFFEWGRIGHATTSRQIKSLPHATFEQVHTLQQELTKRLPSVPVRVNS